MASSPDQPADVPRPVNPEELRALVSGLELDDLKHNDYIAARWLAYVRWWDRRAKVAKRWYLGLRSVAVVGGALIPALVSLREVQDLSRFGWAFTAAAILVSLTVAIASGLESLFGWGDIWRQKRVAAERIKSEGFSFLQLCGSYAGYGSHKEAFCTFANRTEELIQSEIGDYVAAVSGRGDRDDRGAGRQRQRVVEAQG
ncbi:MAG: DUF4231 domain-containing protein [Rubrivivax sp.]|nr:DUF4231 domain-containing protein [Rubrivivax sp.]